jgi:hypothetical protein
MTRSVFVRNEANSSIADFRNGTGQPASAFGGVVRFRIADWGQPYGGTPALQPAASGLRRAKCAKQTQFPPDGIPHRSTMLSFHDSSPMPIMQNEPNLAGRAGPRRAKMCKTKPIWEARLRSGESIMQNEANLPGGLGAWAVGYCTNKANFRRCNKKGKCLARKELW